MNRNLILTAAAAAAIPAAIVWATPAQAAPKPAAEVRLASTSATTTGLCWVSPDHAARLSVSRYPVSGGVQYHLDENSSTPILGTKYWQASITISGVTIPSNEQYRTFTGTQSRTIRGYWNTSTGLTTSCAVTL